MSSILIVCLVAAIVSYIYVISTSGSYREAQTHAWVQQWSHLKDVKFIIALNILFIIVYFANDRFQFFRMEKPSTAFYFISFIITSIVTVFFVRYITDIKKEAPSVWNRPLKK
jgi:hypothetical protein